MMLTPQFSLRRLLLIVTVCAVLSLVPAVAGRGYLWAVALGVALSGALVLAVVSALLFAVTRLLGGMLNKNQDHEPGN